MFDRAQFVADCQAAVAGGRGAVRDVLARAVADPASVLRALGEPRAGGIETLYRGPDLTIVNVIWPGHAVHVPHDHAMWATIGVYAGREDNILWRRLPEGGVEAAGAKSLGVGDTLALGPDGIHSVVNAVPQLTCALQAYGGDFFEAQRSEWDPLTHIERPYDRETTRRVFAAAGR